MKATLVEDAQISPIMQNYLHTCTEMKGAVAWVGKNDFVDLMARHPSKISKFVIGTHLHHSHPSALTKLLAVPTVKYIPPTGQLFHPKLYIFRFTTRIAAFIGSHNLTGAAFTGGNTEISTLIEGTIDDHILRDAVNFVDETWDGPRAKGLTKIFIAGYAKERKKVEARRNKLEKDAARLTPVPKITSPIEFTWPRYVHAVRNGKYSRLPKRLAVLKYVGHLLRGNQTFKDFSPEDREAVAGIHREDDGTDWGWFGSMIGHGDFVNLVQKSPGGLSAALAHIPNTGDVSEDQFNAYAERFRRSFSNKTHKPRIASPSRLLAMKRPDQFICIDGPNERKLCKALGVAYSTVNLDNYWRRVIVPIRASLWWQQTKPTEGLHGQIWENRVALLDCIYYQPQKKKKKN